MRAYEFINEAWSNKYKRSINCSNPKGFSQRAHCQGRKKHNEDICDNHISPSGVETTMCPDDDDYEINYGKDGLAAENFADGRNPQDKGDSKRHGVPTKASISTLRRVAKQGGRKGQLAHWMANMKAGRAKKK